jgi:hypothetical protein
VIANTYIFDFCIGNVGKLYLRASNLEFIQLRAVLRSALLRVTTCLFKLDFNDLVVRRGSCTKASSLHSGRRIKRNKYYPIESQRTPSSIYALFAPRSLTLKRTCRSQLATKAQRRCTACRCINSEQIQFDTAEKAASR